MPCLPRSRIAKLAQPAPEPQRVAVLRGHKDGREVVCQHQDKREPKSPPFRGPAFDGLIGGDAVKTL
jgi:hypothetical protein